MSTKSSTIIGGSIIVGLALLGVILGIFLKQDTVNTDTGTKYRYELIRANEVNMFIFDKSTGESWRKFIPNNEGPTEWTKEDFSFNQ